MDDGPDDENDELWRYVTKDVKPLPRRAVPGNANVPARPARVRRERPPEPACHLPLPSVAPQNGPPGIDRSTDEKLRRGKMAIQGRLDLHGLTRDEAHLRLQEFLAVSYRKGRRCLLVITGKGAGILRGEVQRWLGETPLSGIVLRFYAAQREHGGDGAFYVLLRRDRDRAED